MNSKISRPFARSLLLAVILSLFAAAFADNRTEPPKPVRESLEGKEYKLCGG